MAVSLDHQQLRHRELQRNYMSRHGTPASELGRLAIGGSSTSSSGRSADMPVTTRAMRRGQGTGSGSQQSSAMAAAGPSRGNGRSMRSQRSAQGGRRGGGNGGGGDSDDSDGSDDSDEDDEATRLRQQNTIAAFEVAAALDQQYLAPRELMAASRDNVQRKLADALASRFREQSDLATLRGILTRPEALTRIQTNLRQRYNMILARITADINSPGRGLDVVTALSHLRSLASAIGQHIESYSAGLPDGGRSLVGILFNMLSYLTDNDVDLYANAGVARPQYAGGGNEGNIFRQFVMQHMGIMEVFVRLDAALLRERQNDFGTVIQKVRANGPSNGDRDQFQRLLNVMRQVWDGIRAD